MPGVVRLGDICTGHACYPPRPNVSGASTVFVNNILVHRQTDQWSVHCCSISCHSGVQVGSSGTVYVEGLGVARIGDSISCNSRNMTGSVNVFAGN